MEMLLRNILLFLAKSQAANRLAKRYGLRFGAQRFVAGQSIPDALAVTRTLNAAGIMTALDHLGESVFTEEEAVNATKDCLDTLDAIAEAGVQSRLSIKLTQLGLDIDRNVCRSNVRKILEKAQGYGNFVRIDMEDYAHNEVTLDIFRELHEQFPNTIGLVIQAYLYKSEKDVEQLGREGVNLRLVKGAYKEPKSVAFPEKADVDRNFIELLERHLVSGNFTAIATHDEAVIDHMKLFIQNNNIPRDRFEFQMLYGIRTSLQQSLVLEGYTVRVYVPFGRDWYAYFMRRLAERPANVGFVMRSMIKS